MVGAVLVSVAALGGLWFSLWPRPGSLDGRLLDLVGASNSRWFVDVASLRYPWVIMVGAVCCAVIALPTDRARSLACLVGPPVALLVAEVVAKPLVGRTFGGALTYPSGSVVGAAALATAVVVVTPPRWRPLTVVLGGLYALWVAVAVVALRWHYPTDALAGLALGAGVVALVDGASWWLFARLHSARRRRTGLHDAPLHGRLHDSGLHDAPGAGQAPDRPGSGSPFSSRR